jgi:hypothetical protein
MFKFLLTKRKKRRRTKMNKQTEKEIKKADNSERRKTGNLAEVEKLLAQTNVNKETRIGVKKTAQLLVNSTPKRLWDFDELKEFFVGRSPVTIEMQLRKLINDKNASIKTIVIQGNKYYGCESVVTKINEKIEKILAEACKNENKNPESNSPDNNVKTEGAEHK